MGGHVLIDQGIFKNANDKTLVPQLINLLSDTTPWLVGLLAVCALGAMQSTGAAYMSTFSGMVTRDLFRKYISPESTDKAQKLCGRIFVVVITVAALVVAARSNQAIVMLGGLAVAYGFQMYPALMGICYFPRLTRKGVVWGLVAGLVAVTLTDKTVVLMPDLLKLFLPTRFDESVSKVIWGPYPCTIHSAGWGIFFNLLVAIVISLVFPESGSKRKMKLNRHLFLQAVSGIPNNRRKYVRLAWLLTLIWFLVGFGPFAVVGNTLFSDPSNPSTWQPFGLPSLWIWQLLMLLYGIFVMWFLAFHIGLSNPVAPERVEEVYEEHFGKRSGLSP